MDSTKPMEEEEESEATETTPSHTTTTPKRKNQIEPPDTIMPPGTTRRTRSQVAPDWTTAELFILVNEISAVENDCLKALSSYQKWKIIVENCTAQEVCRTLNQCRGKWNSLLAEYNQINQWDAKSTIGSYWELEGEKRKDLGLPMAFDPELFRVVDAHVRAQKDQMDTDPDSDTDPEAEADLLDVIAKLGSKRKKRRPTALKNYENENPQIYHIEENHLITLPEEELHEVPVEESPHIGCEIENPVVIHANDEPQEILVEQEPVNAEDEPQVSHIEETPQEINAEEKPQNICEEEKPIYSQPRKKNTRMGKKEKHMAESLRQNAELIHAIVNGTLPGLTNLAVEELKNVDDFQTYISRRQAEKLIACLGDIVNTLEQFPSLVQECE